MNILNINSPQSQKYNKLKLGVNLHHSQFQKDYLLFLLVEVLMVLVDFGVLDFGVVDFGVVDFEVLVLLLENLVLLVLLENLVLVLLLVPDLLLLVPDLLLLVPDLLEEPDDDESEEDNEVDFLGFLLFFGGADASGDFVLFLFLDLVLLEIPSPWPIFTLST